MLLYYDNWQVDHNGALIKNNSLSGLMRHWDKSLSGLWWFKTCDLH